jgi:hypothetical protein
MVTKGREGPISSVKRASGPALVAIANHCTNALPLVESVHRIVDALHPAEVVSDVMVDGERAIEILVHETRHLRKRRRR